MYFIPFVENNIFRTGCGIVVRLESVGAQKIFCMTDGPMRGECTFIVAKEAYYSKGCDFSNSEEVQIWISPEQYLTIQKPFECEGYMAQDIEEYYHFCDLVSALNA